VGDGVLDKVKCALVWLRVTHGPVLHPHEVVSF
jgi:hypothetical protein